MSNYPAGVNDNDPYFDDDDPDGLEEEYCLGCGIPLDDLDAEYCDDCNAEDEEDGAIPF